MIKVPTPSKEEAITMLGLKNHNPSWEEVKNAFRKKSNDLYDAGGSPLELATVDAAFDVLKKVYGSKA